MANDFIMPPRRRSPLGGFLARYTSGACAVCDEPLHNGRLLRAASKSIGSLLHFSCSLSDAERLALQRDPWRPGTAPQAVDGDDLVSRLRAMTGLPLLFHFTAIENLPTIFELGGLWSKQRLEWSGRWPCPQPGGDQHSLDHDAELRLWPFVHLSLLPGHPMAIRRYWEGRSLCVLGFDLDIAGREGVHFTDRNSATSDVRVVGGLEGVEALDDISQAEVLVPDGVRTDSIREIWVADDSARVSVIAAARDVAISCTVDPSLFLPNLGPVAPPHRLPGPVRENPWSVEPPPPLAPRKIEPILGQILTCGAYSGPVTVILPYGVMISLAAGLRLRIRWGDLVSTDSETGLLARPRPPHDGPEGR